MEDYNYFTNDFLSNGGFQQLYSTFEYPDEILWDTRVIGDSVDYCDGNVCLDNGVSNWHEQQSDDYATQSSNCEKYAAEHSPQYYNFDMNPISTDSDLIHSMDSMLYNQWNEVNYATYDHHNDHNDNTITQCQLIQNDWEFNLDNLLLLDDGFESTAAPVADLPDRTFFCNDSCNIFLKESSDSLNSNLQSFLPQPGSALPEASEKKQRTSNGQEGKCARGIENRAVDDKSFICTYNDCGKVYAKAGHLKAHIRRHVGDKPYQCVWPNCTWKFSRSDELSRHRRSHSGHKPYKCDYCPKQFSRSDHLSKHRKVHERKMAAMKMKAVWTTIPQGRPGRRPKVLVPQT